MPYDMTLLKDGCSQLGMDIDSVKLSMFETYMELLLEWNQKINLTAITEPRDVIVEHFLDSVSILALGKINKGDTVLDIGTGAGFPGLPIKIMIPGIKLVLMDSIKKKTAFLEEVVGRLGLRDVNVINGRAEDLGREANHRQSYDLVVSRAVAEYRVLLEYCLPFVKLNGLFAAYKGPSAAEEAASATKALRILGGTEPEIINAKVPYSEKTHIIVLTKKLINTPKEFPRPAGKPKKSPL